MTTPDPAGIAAEQAAKHGIQVGKYLYRKARLLGTFEVEWLAMPDGHSLTARDLTDLRAFLASDAVRPLIALTASCLVVSGDAYDSAREAFRSEALRWDVDHPSGWMAELEFVWGAIVDVLQGKIQGNERLATEFRKEFEEYGAFASSPFSNQGAGFAADFFDLFSDMQRLQSADGLADRIALRLAAKSLPSIVTHAEVSPDDLTEFQALYVPRLLVDSATGTPRDSDEVTASGKGWRMVIRGDPGAGKSTSVRHLTWRLAQNLPGEPIQPGLLMRCRDYFANGWGEPIVDYLRRTVAAQTGVSCGEEAFADALLLGRFVCIFDGLDEITDPNNRGEFVSRLEAFVTQYPMLSVLVTSRSIGYSRTPLSNSMFDHFMLREFSDEQIESYATRWFELQSSPQLIVPFLRDSETVLDLRSNPLLLSLLCILYKARGAIPRRRREVYGRCADLLFNTWDSHRQIEQPEELPAYGGRLMQEIARWVYGSAAAQRGLEEQQIRKVIALYLESVSITPDEARLRAADFLEFCAGRAWLLGSFGSNDRGQRMFAFTHRTFYEYFTAEAFSRRVKSVEELCDLIVESFQKDGTSVLPELLIQSYEERVDGGAREAFKELCSRKMDATILLRLMNGSLLAANVRDLGFSQLTTQWSAAPGKSTVGLFDALLSLDMGALRQLDERHVQGSEAAQALIATAWATRVLTLQDHVYPAEVGEWAQRYLHVEGLPDQHGLLANARWVLGITSDVPAIPTSLMSMSCYNAVIPGAAWHVLIAANLAAETEYEGCEPLIDWLDFVSAGSSIPHNDAVQFGSELDNYAWVASRVATALQAARSPKVRVLACWASFSLAASLAEVGACPVWLRKCLDDSGLAFSAATDLRRIDAAKKMRRAAHAMPTEDEVARREEALTAAQDLLPPWVVDWISNKFQLARNPWDVPESL